MNVPPNRDIEEIELLSFKELAVPTLRYTSARVG
jgi:hypothetical protein